MIHRLDDPTLHSAGGLPEVRRAITDAVALNPALEPIAARMLAWAEQGESILFRESECAHFTASALVLSADGERTAMMHHRKLGRWLQPGGHADGEGNLLSVAAREAVEELGLMDGVILWPPIDLDIHTIPARNGVAEHLHLDVRFLLVAFAEDLSGNGESNDVAWLDAGQSSRTLPQDVAGLILAGARRFTEVRKALRD